MVSAPGFPARLTPPSSRELLQPSLRNPTMRARSLATGLALWPTNHVVQNVWIDGGPETNDALYMSTYSVQSPPIDIP